MADSEGKLSDFYCIRTNGLSIYLAVAEILRQTGDVVTYRNLNAVKADSQYDIRSNAAGRTIAKPYEFYASGNGTPKCLRRFLRLRNQYMVHSLREPIVNRRSTDALMPEVCLDSRRRYSSRVLLFKEIPFLITENVEGAPV